MKLIFATNNPHKVQEIKQVLPSFFSIITLQEAGINIEIPEPHDTLWQNAAEKATVIYNLTKTSCFSEDTGLEVPALNNEPGVKSARYAGDDCSSEKNIAKLLFKLQQVTNRNAQFRTVIYLMLNKEVHYFEGVCAGSIINEPKGNGGFGYDPVFVPNGSEKTFAQMNMEEKSRYSHRSKAMARLVAFLKHYSINSKP